MTAESLKPADTARRVHELVAGRWSPYVFEARSVPAADLAALFEAARWAPSAYNEQPWRYIVATRHQPEAFARVLSCLVDANQAWAKHASALALGCHTTTFAKNGKPNAAAAHDLGASSVLLAIEAASRGLVVHQMIGILPDKARELFHVPKDVTVLTGLAIGYAGEPSKAPAEVASRDAARRPRNPASSFVFGDDWDKPGLR